MNTRKIVRISLLSALLVVLQVGLSYLPNIELVCLLFIIYTLHLTIDECIWICVVFSTLEGMIYGFHIWTIMYYVIWSLYCIVSYQLRGKINSWMKAAILASIYGFIFGTLHSIPYFIIGGYKMGIAYISAGLLFDLVHGIGNFILTAILFDSFNLVFEKVVKARRW